MHHSHQFFNISTRDEVYRFDAASVVYLRARGNYTDIMTIDQRTITVCSSLSHVHGILNESIHDWPFCFARVGKSLVVNMAYVSQINVPGQFMILSDHKSFATKLTATKTSLRELKNRICGEQKQKEFPFS